MRASMKSANLLTGSLYIDLDFYPQEKRGKGRASCSVIR